MPKVNIRPEITDNVPFIPPDYVRQVGNFSAIHEAPGQSQRHLLAVAGNTRISLGKPENNVRHHGEANATEEDKRSGQPPDFSNHLANPGEERPPGDKAAVIGITD
jgi:hypothetical protein